MKNADLFFTAAEEAADANSRVHNAKRDMINELLADGLKNDCVIADLLMRVDTQTFKRVFFRYRE